MKFAKKTPLHLPRLGTCCCDTAKLYHLYHDVSLPYSFSTTLRHDTTGCISSLCVGTLRCGQELA